MNKTLLAMLAGAGYASAWWGFATTKLNDLIPVLIFGGGGISVWIIAETYSVLTK